MFPSYLVRIIRQNQMLTIFALFNNKSVGGLLTLSLAMGQRISVDTMVNSIWDLTKTLINSSSNGLALSSGNYCSTALNIVSEGINTACSLWAIWQCQRGRSLPNLYCLLMRSLMMGPFTWTRALIQNVHIKELLTSSFKANVNINLYFYQESIINLEI